MKNHTINIPEIALVYHNLLAASHGNGDSKTLTMYTIPGGDQWYEVMDHGQKIYSGSSLIDAIDIYNRS